MLIWWRAVESEGTGGERLKWLEIGWSTTGVGKQGEWLAFNSGRKVPLRALCPHLLARPESPWLEDGGRGQVDVLGGVGEEGHEAAEVGAREEHVLLGEEVGACEKVLGEGWERERERGRIGWVDAREGEGW